MPKQILLLIFIFTLSACAQPTPAPTATFVPPTATLTPAPTSTPSPMPTPEFWRNAVSEYGMPEKMAQELLAGVEVERVEFVENESPYVRGVTLVVDGEDVAFRNDEPLQRDPGDDPNKESAQAMDERWVRVDEFEGSFDVDNITEIINGFDGLTSVETNNLLYYYAAKWQPDVENAKEAAFLKDAELGGIKYVQLLPDSVPVSGNLGLLANVDLPDNGIFTEHVFVPVLIFDKQTQKIYPIKLVIRGGKDVMNQVLDKWKKYYIDAGVMPGFITGFSADKKYPTQVTIETEEAYTNSTFTMVERFAAFEDGNLSVLSDQNIVVAAFAP